MKIKGKVTKIDLGTGFWAIIGDDGHEWRPINMPEQLKVKDKRVIVHAKKAPDAPSIFMWGEPIVITEFET